MGEIKYVYPKKCCRGNQLKKIACGGNQSKQYICRGIFSEKKKM
jgi:hypothetical protein